MTAPAFLVTPSQALDAELRLSDRTADLRAVVVYLSADVMIHVHDAAQARALAATFTRAAELFGQAAEDGAR